MATSPLTSTPLPGPIGEFPGRDRHVFSVCTGEKCRNAGANELVAELKHHQCQRSANEIRVGQSRCLGHCQLAPAMMANGRMMGWMSLRRLRFELMRIGLFR